MMALREDIIHWQCIGTQCAVRTLTCHHEEEGSTQRTVVLDFLIDQTEQETTLINWELDTRFIMKGNWIRLSNNI